MNKIRTLCALSVLVLSLASEAKNIEFGGGADLNKLVAATEVLENVNEFKEREITVSGKVTKVCKKRGCWMTLQVDNGESLNVKVRDGDMVFPMSAIGKRAFATGRVEHFKLDIAKTKRYLAHKAHENGEQFDETKVIEGMELIRLKPDAVTIIQESE
ncbi:DUF4920 domain-containing protein [Pseudoalteromonas sp. McH1-7]|uniref:DUF4920 domain-containing protein n=1 Tax=unclassified Pseudoalteromonas TaxID=194690 RepID=UPI0015928467|nr:MULTISPECIES: DUF4920 domain-containing protein [unclassified Pseudoalteromonas]NUZ11290.1 DUF4920 domain-containing protein [Pseudoalteromonas sp. McH1-7]USD27664.1 DUF4920 domain-containing protein [Pseudoalteromonas sp. SCSIO 43201]